MIHSPRLRAVALGGWLARHQYALPLLILLIGAAFRFYQLNWDNGHQLHPDERWIYEVLSGANNNPPLSWPGSISQFFDGRDAPPNAPPNSGIGSPLNPHFFAYGSLPFYMLGFLAGAVSIIGQHVSLLSGWAGVDSYANLPPLGRGFSGVLDLLSVFLVFLLGRRVFGYWTGVVAMALAAFTVLEIQLSHFFTVDTVLLPFCLLTLLAAVEIAREQSRRAYLWGGVALGAALATKTTALLLVIPLGSAALLEPWNRVPFARHRSLRDRLTRHYGAVGADLNRNLQWLLGTYFIGAAAFVIFEPYAVLDRPTLLSNIAEQTTFLVTNNPPFVVPFTIQYANTIPYVFQLQNILFWSMGLPLSLAALAGVVWGGWRFLRLRLPTDQLVLLLWAVPYFLFVGRFFAKFNRYMLPILPVLTLFGAALLVSILRRARGRRRLAAIVLLSASVGGSFLYSLAYMNIYAQPNTRVAASRWMFNTIPAGTNIGVEGPWDDPLPLDEQGHLGASYHATNLDLYAGEDAITDSDHKIANITDVLQHDQYIIMSSERLIGSIPKLPLRYPVANRYYGLLFGGKLNFRLVRVFAAHPQLGPVVVEDYAADESFHVYDHPIVRIFQRTGPISAARVRTLLTTGLVKPPATIDPATLPVILRPATVAPDTRLMLTSAQWQADQQGPTYAQMFPANGFGMQHPLLLWWLLLEFLGILAFPLAFILFGRLLERGFVLAKTIGMLLLGYAVWITVSLGLGTYEQGLIVVVFGALTILSGVAWYLRRVVLLAWLRAHWRPVLAGELVFLLGFAIFIGLRMWYPDLQHQWSPVSAGNVGGGRMGEKQMEFAYLNAIVRSRVFPPFDPFFAHGYINYYYYGLFLVGTLCKLTTIMPATGFNLAIATFFALLVGNCYSVAAGVTRRIAPGVFAAVFVGLLGNLAGAWQLIQALMTVATTHSDLPFFGGVVDTVSGLQQVIVARQTLPPFDFWAPTRIVPPGGVISEFPYFTYLFADLHPHLMAYPMVAAALALAVNLMRGGYAHLRTRLAAVVLGALLLGAIAVTNPWDYPTFLVVVGLGALIGAWIAHRRFSLGVVLRPVVWLGCLAAGSALLYLPFKQSYQTVFTTGVGLVRDISPDVLQNATICPDQSHYCPAAVHDALVTPLSVYLEHFGLFLFVMASYLLLVTAREFAPWQAIQRYGTAGQFLWYYRERPRQVLHAVRVARKLRLPHVKRDLSVFYGMIVVVLGLVALRYYLLAFLVAMGSAIALQVAIKGRTLSGGRMFVLGLFTLGVTLSILTQIFFIKDFLADGPMFRMNTIFKFYDQVWLFYALGSACTLYYFMTSRLSARHIRLGTATHPGGYHRRHARGSLAVLTAAQQQSIPLQLAYETRGPGAAASHTLAPASEETGGEPAPLPVGVATRRAGRFERATRRPMALLQRERLWGACLAVLIAGSLVYTYAGTIARETYRALWLPENSVPATLDGSAFMKVAYPGEYDAITWLNAHVHGNQIIAEAAGAYYDWRSRVSEFTGLPVIFGGFHEDEQRFADELDPGALCANAVDPGACSAQNPARKDTEDLLYDTASIPVAEGIIQRYGIRYIYLGFSEQQCVHDTGNGQVIQCYSRAGLAKFNRMVGHGLRIAYRRRGVTIYEVTGT